MDKDWICASLHFPRLWCLLHQLNPLLSQRAVLRRRKAAHRQQGWLVVAWDGALKVVTYLL